MASVNRNNKESSQLHVICDLEVFKIFDSKTHLSGEKCPVVESEKKI
jgi:hypothetical protein